MQTPISKKEAESKNYRPLTTGYLLPGDQHLLDKVLADMASGQIDHVLVLNRRRIEVWRHAPASSTSSLAS